MVSAVPLRASYARRSRTTPATDHILYALLLARDVILKLLEAPLQVVSVGQVRLVAEDADERVVLLPERAQLELDELAWLSKRQHETLIETSVETLMGALVETLAVGYSS